MSLPRGPKSPYLNNGALGPKFQTLNGFLSTQDLRFIISQAVAALIRKEECVQVCGCPVGRPSKPFNRNTRA